jgi:hypothetical protein
MASGSLMLQIAVEQTFAGTITDLPEMWAVALEPPDGNQDRPDADARNRSL